MGEERELVIVSVTRTAIGRFMGALSTISAPRLEVVVIREAVKRASIDPRAIDEVIMDCIVRDGQVLDSTPQAAINGSVP
ncbi:MAG: hypothetical protein ACETWB_05845 [Anaerolineae bacterium]